ncbi:hypothetical protein VSR01_09600 [Actinacidiphila sp. DG2A-62]|uniref:hypothetical protein n=1 Tax=Actinacidiphila sp. DG2A-62 TaxID=3108821 RepID=UPI002DBB15B1|nr:hypothetical protein [Actinacidiphila sp. DG2A-62]MEC3993780.1 hypothetical protein [Actinacidiphila sp. DG2A-62]
MHDLTLRISTPAGSYTIGEGGTTIGLLYAVGGDHVARWSPIGPSDLHQDRVTSAFPGEWGIVAAILDNQRSLDHALTGVARAPRGVTAVELRTALERHLRGWQYSPKIWHNPVQIAAIVVWHRMRSDLLAGPVLSLDDFTTTVGWCKDTSAPLSGEPDPMGTEPGHLSVDLLSRLADIIHVDGIRVPDILDGAPVPARQVLDQLLRAPDTTRVGWLDIEDALHRAGPGSMALVLLHHPTRASGAIAAYYTYDHGIHWADLQNGPDQAGDLDYEPHGTVLDSTATVQLTALPAPPGNDPYDVDAITAADNPPAPAGAEVDRGNDLWYQPVRAAMDDVLSAHFPNVTFTMQQLDQAYDQRPRNLRYGQDTQPSNQQAEALGLAIVQYLRTGMWPSLLGGAAPAATHSALAWKTTPSGYALPSDTTEYADALGLEPLPAGARALALAAPDEQGTYTVRGKTFTTAELAEQITARLTADGVAPPRRLVVYGPRGTALAQELSRLLAPYTVDVLGAHGDPRPASGATGLARRTADRFHLTATPTTGWTAYRDGLPIDTGLLGPRATLTDVLTELEKPAHWPTTAPARSEPEPEPRAGAEPERPAASEQPVLQPSDTAVPQHAPAPSRPRQRQADAIDAIEPADPAAVYWEPEEAREGPAWDPAVLERARSVLRTLRPERGDATAEEVARFHDRLPSWQQSRNPHHRGEAIAQLIAGTEPPRLRGGAPAAVEAGQPTQARPLFPSMYFGDDTHRDYWLRLARGYEAAVLRALQQRVSYRQAAQATLAALVAKVTPMVPPGRAARVFFPQDKRPSYQLTAQLDALLEWAPAKAPQLGAVMAAVGAGARFYAARQGLTVPPVDPGLTRRLWELGHPVPETPDGGRTALIRSVERLLLVHRRIGVVSLGHLYGAGDEVDANAVAFRGAVFATFAGRLSLAELFGAAQRAGVVDTDMAVPPQWMEPDFRNSTVVQADVAELHGLVPYLLSPESIDPTLRRFPHEKRYAQMAADLLELDVDGSGDGRAVTDLIDALDSGTVTFRPDQRDPDRWRQRREAFIAWLREHRHHYQGATPGHLIALYLLGGPDATLTLLGLDAAPHAARRSVLRGRILGWLERLVQGADEAELPLVMRREPLVAELVAHPALGTPQHLASLADDLASDELMAELAEHAEMQRRALLTLPETEGPVWWGESAPGPSHGSVQPGGFVRPALSRVTLDGGAAVRDAFEAVDRSGSGVPVVYWVEQPSKARAFGPFAQRPGDHAAYPDDVEFRPLKPQWVWDVQRRRWYLRIPLEQVERTDGPVWRADPVVRLVSTDSGIPFAYSAINSADWPHFSWNMVHLPGATDYMLQNKDGSFDTLPTPLVASGFDSVGRPNAVAIETHGLPNDVVAAYSREGLARGSGTVAARLADRVMRLTGRDPVTQDVLLVVCYAAQGARSAGQTAANRGRGGRVIAGNAVVVTASAPGTSLPDVYVQGEKGGPDPRWQQFGKQPVPVPAELRSALPFAGRRPGRRRWFGNGTRGWQDIAEQHEKFLGAALAGNPGLAGFASGLAAALRSAGFPVLVQGAPTLVNVMRAIDDATRDDRVYVVAGDGAQRRAFLEERGLLVRTGEQPSTAALFAAQRAVVFDRQPATTAADDHRWLLAAVIGWRLSTGTATLADVLEDYARNVGGDDHGIDLAGLRDALLGDAVDLYDWARRTLAPFTGSWEDLPKRYDESWQPAHHRMPHPAFASIARRLFTRTATLAQVFDDYAIATAANQAVSTAGLNDALLGDVTDVYDWVSRNLARHIGGLQDLVARHGHSALPPHHRMYLTHQAKFAAEPIGDLKVPEGLVRAIGVMSGQMPPGTQGVAHQAGAASWAERQAAVSAWIRTHGGSPLDLLRPAHVTALFLATHEPDQRLLRGDTDALSAFADGAPDFPYLLTQDSRFAQLSQDPALSDPSDLRHQEVRSRLLQRGRLLADRALPSIPLHLGILGEALARLPHLPEGERVYVAVHWPDAPGAAAAPMPEVMTIPAFQPAWRTLEDALTAVDASPPGFHRTVIAVDGSAARDVSFASGRPGLRQAMFPWDTEIQVTSYGWMPDAGGRPYESVAATDRTANTRHVTYGPQPAAPQPQTVPGPSQPALAGAAFSSHALPVRQETAGEARPAGRRLQGGAPSAQHSATAGQSAQQDTASPASQPGPSSLPSAAGVGQSRQARALFPSLYFGEDEEDWEEWVGTALRYEKQVGRSMAGSADLLHAAQATLDALVKQVAALVPKGEERRVFFPQDGRSSDQLRDDLDALLVTDDTNEEDEEDEKGGKKLPSLTAVMDAVERGAEFYAARNNLQVVPMNPELARELHDLGYPVAENLSAEKKARLAEFERLLLVHGRIGVTNLGARTRDFSGQDTRAVVFRNAAIASKLLQSGTSEHGDRADVPTLVEWIGAAQRAGVVDTDMAVPPRRMEPDVSTAGSVEADVAGFYGLVPFLFESESRDLRLRRLPHEVRYEEWTEDLLYPDLIDTEVDLDTLRRDLASDAMSIAAGSARDRDLWQQRRWAFIEWMQEHRRRYPRAPYAGYLAALHLLGGADAVLMDPAVTAVPPPRAGRSWNDGFCRCLRGWTRVRRQRNCPT